MRLRIGLLPGCLLAALTLSVGPGCHKAGHYYPATGRPAPQEPAPGPPNNPDTGSTKEPERP
jgi:hypothetical protein